LDRAPSRWSRDEFSLVRTPIAGAIDAIPLPIVLAPAPPLPLSSWVRLPADDKKSSKAVRPFARLVTAAFTVPRNERICGWLPLNVLLSSWMIVWS
jgi:hypothetical protein